MRQRSPFKIGQLIAGRYSVRGFLGAGSMGWVLKVADLALGGEIVALKVLYPHLLRDPAHLSRFRQEVATARQLTHPSIIHLHDFEENVDGETFIAMEYIRGTDLADLLIERHGKGLPLDEAVLILLRIAQGLLYAHQQGIIHRDLKPSNILLGQSGEVRICDFGLAQSVEHEFGLTRTGEVFGTPRYMAPEQFEGQELDQRVDIYSFGMIAYELLSGSTPFQGDDFFTLAGQHLEQPCPAVRSAATQVPEWLDELIARCCAKSRAERPLSFREIVAVLEAKLPESTRLNLKSLRPFHRRRLPAHVNQRLLTTVWCIIAVVLFEWWYAQSKPRVMIMSAVLSVEAQLGFELQPLKWLLGIDVSLLRRKSIFELLEQAKSGKKESRHQLSAMLQAERHIVTDPLGKHEWLANERGPNGETLFQTVVKSGLPALIDNFDSAGYEHRILDTEGETAYTYAIRHQLRNALRDMHGMRDYGAGIPNARGDFPMHIAVLVRDRDTVSTLLDRHIEPNRVNRQGLTPIHLAVQLRDIETLQLFSKAGVSFQLRDSLGRTPLMYAATLDGMPQETLQLVDFLVAQSREQPRHRSAPVASTLEARDNDGKTALMLAGELHHDDIARRLIAAGAKLDTVDGQGRSASSYVQGGSSGAIR